MRASPSPRVRDLLCLPLGILTLLCLSACGRAGGSDVPLQAASDPVVTSISPSRLYVSAAPIPFEVEGTWQGEKRNDVTVRFRAESGRPFLTPRGGRTDVLELPSVMSNDGQVSGAIPAWAAAEATKSYVEVLYGGASAGISSHPLGVFNIQQEIPAPAGSSGWGFGEAIALSGDTLIAGEWRDDGAEVRTGAAYVYVRSGISWILQQKLTASDGESDDKFGWSVAISGDTVVVGSFWAQGVTDHSGAAYVFVRDGTTWTEEAKLIAADGVTHHEFAIEVAIDGDTVAVGATGDGDVATAAGSVYVFTRSGATWSEQQELHTASAGFGHWLGRSIAIDGDALVAGAPHSDSMGLNGGAAHVFTRSGSVWTEQQELLSSDGTTGDALGWSVDISADRIVVGSTRWNVPGGVYVFVRTGSMWTEELMLLAPGGALQEGFGRDVVIEGQRIIVAADANAVQADNAGAVYVFERGAPGWLHVQTLYASDAADGDSFGDALALDSGRLVVGAGSHEHTTTGPSGAIYVH